MNKMPVRRRLSDLRPTYTGSSLLLYCSACTPDDGRGSFLHPFLCSQALTKSTDPSSVSLWKGCVMDPVSERDDGWVWTIDNGKDVVLMRLSEYSLSVCKKLAKAQNNKSRNQATPTPTVSHLWVGEREGEREGVLRKCVSNMCYMWTMMSC